MQTIIRRMTVAFAATLVGLLASTQLAATEPGFSEGESITLEPNSSDYIVTYTGNENQALTTVFEPATKINPLIHSKINLGNDGLITYSYAVESAADSRQRIISVFVDPVSNIKARRSVRPTLSDSALDDSEILDRYRACIEAIQAPAGWSGECLDRRDKSSTWLSLGWVYDYRAGAQRGLPPGAAVQGMAYTSFDLPGISVGRLEGKAVGWKNNHDPSPGDMDEYSLSKAFEQKLIGLEEMDFVTRHTAAPTFEVQNPFSGAPLLEKIRAHVKSWPQQQLMEQAFWQQIDGLLAAAINALKNGDTAGAASNLAQIRVELRKKYPDLDVMTALDDPKASALPTAPDALKAYLSAHDQRLAAKALDFDVAYVMDRLGVSVPVPDAKTPVITISPSKQVVEGNSGTTTLPFDVYRVGDLARESKVNFATREVTPNNGDYIAASGVVSFPIGISLARIAVTINSDRVTEPTETFLVTLSNPDNARIGSDTAIGLIIDDDPSSSDLTHPQPTITISPSNQVVEGNTGTTTISVEVYRVGDLKGSSSVAYTTQDLTATSADYVPASGQLNFVPGAQKATIVITIRGDTVPEASESLLVRLSAPVSATLSGDAGAVTIIDDDR